MDSGNKTKTTLPVVINVDDKLEQCFLGELAKEQGFKAWTKPRSHSRTYIEATRKQVDTLIKKAAPALAILDQRKLEMMAEAMIYAGSANLIWPGIISQAQAYVRDIVKKSKHLHQRLETVEKARKERRRDRELIAQMFVECFDNQEVLKNPGS